MPRNGFLTTIFVIVIIAVSFQESSAIKCWKCSSDVKNTQFCNDPFDADKLTADQKRWTYLDCQNPPLLLNPYHAQTNQKPVCKKVKGYSNGQFVTSRSCFWEDLDMKTDCSDMRSFEKIEFCETCDEDGCNTAIHFGPISWMLVIFTAALLLFI